MSFDYIVVGGGSAGCVLANRLSANPSHRVLLLEAGGSDRRLSSRIPAAVPLAIASARTNWRYPAEPDSSRAGNAEPWPAGKLLGGGSAINGMLYVRGHRRDYDQWAQLGAKGWRYADVLPYFERMESCQRGAMDGRGRYGPLAVAERSCPHPLDDAFLAAAEELGIKRNLDLNGGFAEGVDYCQMTQLNGWRHSTAQAYLRPVWQRPGLKVQTRALVERILFDGASKAIGVAYRVGKRSVRQMAKRAVVVSAGALASPKLLMLSGIGDEDQLAALGIDCVQHLSGVGRNLQEHVGLRTSAHVNMSTIASEMTAAKLPKHLWRFLRRGTGPLTLPVGQAHAFARTKDELTLPNVQLIFSPFAVEVTGGRAGIHHASAVTIAVGLCRTQGRGRISLASKLADAPPRIEYQALAHQDDLEQLRAGARLARRFFQTQALGRFVTNEHLPGAHIASDADWDAYIREHAFLMYHPCGTCRMGTDEDAVTSPTLAVRKLRNLWIADASVIPTIPSGNLNATSILIGEKGADHILEATA